MYTSRGVPRIASAARAGHGRGPYAVRRIGRGIPRFVGAAAFPELRIQDAGGILLAKKSLPFRTGSVLALPIFLARARDRRCRCGMPGAFRRQKRTCPFGQVLCWRYLFSRPVARQVSSAKVCLTSVFGMGTGGPSPQSTPTSSRYTLKTEHHNILCISVQTRVCAFVGQALGLLVSVSLTHYCAYTPDLSTT